MLYCMEKNLELVYNIVSKWLITPNRLPLFITYDQLGYDTATDHVLTSGFIPVGFLA